MKAIIILEKSLGCMSASKLKKKTSLSLVEIGCLVPFWLVGVGGYEKSQSYQPQLSLKFVVELGV